MALITLNFDEIPQGATFRRDFTLKDANGDVIDLSGCAARMQFRPTYGGVLRASLTTENGKIAIDGPGGTITIEIPAEETAALAIQTLYYDLELIWPSGRVDRLLSGRAPVTPEVTL